MCHPDRMWTRVQEWTLDIILWLVVPVGLVVGVGGLLGAIANTVRDLAR